MKDLVQLLPEASRQLYEVITSEIQPLIDDESWTQAIARVDAILRGIPVDQENRQLRGALLVKRGELYLESERYEEAEEDLRHALHNGMRHPGVWALAGWTQYHLDRPQKAREFFDRVLEQDADDVSALSGRAIVLLDLDELDLARADLTRAIRCDPDNGELYGMRAEIYVTQGDLNHAERDIKRAREEDPGDLDHAILAARISAALGRQSDALQVLVTALRGEEEPPLEALLLRSYLYLTEGKTSQARADAISASNRFPDEAFALVQLAHVQLAEGNVQLAAKAAERAVKLDPSLPDAYLVRGAVRRINGQEAEATADFERASQAPAELPMFLFGPAYDAIDADQLDTNLLEIIGATDPAGAGFPDPNEMDGAGGGNPFAGMGGMGGLGGMDPMSMMSKMFDSEGNLRGPFKPLVQMAFKNAPTILKNMPPSMLKSMGGIDPEMLKHIDMDNLTPEQLEAQMKEFYKMVQSGQDPREVMNKAREEFERQSGDKDS